LVYEENKKYLKARASDVVGIKKRILQEAQI